MGIFGLGQDRIFLSPDIATHQYHRLLSTAKAQLQWAINRVSWLLVLLVECGSQLTDPSKSVSVGIES
jgi:hypothetical protein